KFGRFGKRKFFIMISFIPLCLMMVFLFSAPINIPIAGFAYFLFIIMLFELIYSLFDVNVKALFPEMWPNQEERSKTNIILRILTIFAILGAFLIPTVIPGLTLPDATQAHTNPLNAELKYLLNGGIVALIIFITGFLFIKFGIKEREETAEQLKSRPRFFESLKITLKNKNFVFLVLANMATWYVLTMLTSMFSFYVEFVLGVDATHKAFGVLGTFLYYGISIILAFIVAILTMPVHKKLGTKFGMRNGFIITMAIMGSTFLLFLFFIPYNYISQMFAIITAGIIGFGLSGILFYFDILMGDVIDQDELKSGVKRSASFYGTNAFIHRFSIIFFISSVTLTFQYTPWNKSFEITNPSIVALPLKILFSIGPAIACFIALILMLFYKLHGKRLKEMRTKIRQKADV
ncbi:MAG: MFS transporter, partial [Candidatus Lokiarchaeota archaeon]